MAISIIIIDSSVFIDHLRTNKFKDHFCNLHGVIRNSSVVISELMRGSTKKSEVRFVNTLVKNHPVLTPTEKNWLESGKILSKINEDKGFSPEKLRDLHFDLLIALTGRNFGATIISSDSDFQLIKEYKHFNLILW